MADIVFKAPSGPVNSFCLAADSAKFADLTNFKGVVKKLVYMSEAPYTDNFDSDPEAEGRAVEAGWCPENDFTWDAGNAREKCDSSGGCREFLSYDGLGSDLMDIDAKLLISTWVTQISHNAVGLAARVNKTNKTGYWAGVHYRTDAAAINISIERDETVLDITGNLSNVARRIHFLHVGNVLKLKYWTDGDAEPTTGGPDDDGYQLKATDDTYASGYFGIFTKNHTSARWRYVDELYVISSKYANDSPALYTVFDTGKNNRTISAGDKITIKQTLDSVAGGGKFKVAMNNTLKDGSGGDSDCTTVNTWLNAAWLEVDGSDEITAPENMAGRYLYIMRQFNSDGSQQSNWGMWGGAVEVSIAAASTPSKPTITSLTPGDTEAVVALTADDESDVVYARYRTPDGSWSAESETFKRTGSGNITLTGLTNGQRYQIGIYAKSGDLTSDWDTGYTIPTDGIGDPELSDLDDSIQADMSDIVLKGPGSRKIRYTISGNEAVEIRALVDRSAFSPELTEDGSAKITRALVSISRDPDDGITTPDYKDQLYFDGKDWKMESIDPADMGGLHLLTVYRRERIKLTSSDFSIEEF